ncbi:glycosyltransferase family 2 protein [Psychrilyobacter sp.]|uniref:glycosyltransferase family 2 protein n=1 Tax=Psychrilyobacter sp. TaxID=2586924 RepID=UPI00301AA362
MKGQEKKKYPLVSIIMPCYNIKKFLEKAILSVLEQTYKDYELIIIDNGSTDGSLDIIYKYLDKNIILLKANKNKGVVGSRNKGIRHARGKYIAFLDSDDVWHPEKLSKQILFMEKNDSAISCTEYNIVCEQGKYLYKFEIKEDMIDHSKNLKFNHLGCSTVIYNREKLGKVFFFKKAVYKEDYGLWQKIMKTGIETHVYKEALTDYRLRKGSISSNKVKMAKE